MVTSEPFEEVMRVRWMKQGRIFAPPTDRGVTRSSIVAHAGTPDQSDTGWSREVILPFSDSGLACSRPARRPIAESRPRDRRVPVRC